MASSVVKIISLILGFAVAFGIDKIIAKWVGYFTVLWEKHASEKALKSYNEAVADFKKQSEGAGEQWEKWRQTHTSKHSPED
jgi:hypothetical protein